MTSCSPFEPDNPVQAQPFRFKSTSSKNDPRLRSRSPIEQSQRYHHRRHHRHHGHHRSKRRKKSAESSADPFAPTNLDPEAAFRESLFDALADDEGAAYWEGVYGQPIHTYPRSKSKYREDAGLNDGMQTEILEDMTDEEYVTYVRAKMWEKSHQHIVEERKKREEERNGRRQRDEQARRWEEGVNEALKRGQERREKAMWKRRWDEYRKGWERLTCRDTAGDQPNIDTEPANDRIPWPVLSGLAQDVNLDEIERFFRHAPLSCSRGEGDEVALLKLERVRWHPDKVQQRAGAGLVDKRTMKTVTAVFQCVDQIWSKYRKQ